MASRYPSNSAYDERSAQNGIPTIGSRAVSDRHPTCADVGARYTATLLCATGKLRHILEETLSTKLHRF